MGDLFLVPYVRSVWELLRYRLGPNGRMVLFGAGAHTRWLLSITQDLPPLPIECIIDDDPPEDAWEGIALRRPDAVAMKTIDLVLVSSDRWEEELARRCRSLWDGRVPVVRLYEGLPRGPYDKSDDRTEALRRVGTLTSNEDTAQYSGTGRKIRSDESCFRPLKRPPAHSHRVVIVSDEPRSREAKLGYALKAAGWEPVLLHQRKPSFNAPRYFHEVCHFHGEWQALRIACDYAPAVYHIMVNSDYRVASTFLRYRVGVTVVDSYDLIAGMYTRDFLAAHPHFADEMDRERSCLEQADGLCCRSREADLLEGELRYRLPPRLLFLDGCWNRPVSTPRHSGGELHSVYAGHIPPASATRSGFAASASKLWLARALAAQGIHFHLYPWCDRRGDDGDAALRPYRDLERTTPYFHLHRSVPSDEMADALARYDVALFVYNEFAQPGPIAHNFTRNKFRLCTSNKVFDFLDAGLPILHTAVDHSFISGLLDKHQVQINVRGIEPDDWAGVLGNSDLAQLHRRVARARADYDVRRHVPRLTDFYETLKERGRDVRRPLSPYREHADAVD